MTTTPAATSCGTCGTAKSLRYRDSHGRIQCRSCHRKDETRWEPCDGCRRTRPVNARTDTGKALCGTCYRDRAQPTATCDACGAVRRVAVRAGRRGADRTLCPRC